MEYIILPDNIVFFTDEVIYSDNQRQLSFVVGIMRKLGLSNVIRTLHTEGVRNRGEIAINLTSFSE